jgi:maleate cis-trans isomerase
MTDVVDRSGTVRDTGCVTAAAARALAARDPYGWLAKVGLILPSTNTVNAHEWMMMAPNGVSIDVARAMLLGKSTQESYDAMAKSTEKAAEELATAEVDILAYGCTSGSFMCSRDEITRRLTEIAGVQATTTSDSVIAALKALGVSRVSMVTPYMRFINQGEVRFLQEEGFEVVAEVGLGLGETQQQRRAINRVPQEDILDMVRSVDRPEAEAIFISCTALPSLPLVASIETEMGKPVVTSNQATFWNVLRLLGLKASICGFGTLLEHH